MAHPFEKMFEKALKNSTLLDNQVLSAAEELKEKGYRASEIHAVLTQLAKGRIDDGEAEILREAAEEFGQYLEE